MAGQAFNGLVLHTQSNSPEAANSAYVSTCHHSSNQPTRVHHHPAHVFVLTCTLLITDSAVIHMHVPTLLWVGVLSRRKSCDGAMSAV